MDILELLHLYNGFVKKIESLPLLDINIYKLDKLGLEEISSIEEKNKIILPASLKKFWQNYDLELSASNANKDEAFFSAGFEFYLEKDLSSFREMAEDFAPDSLDYKIHTTGLTISSSEPYLTIDLETENIWWVLYDGDMPGFPIADNFTEFFEHYLAAGCFCSHSFSTYWPIVKDFVPIQIPLEKNKWVRFYSKVYNFK